MQRNGNEKKRKPNCDSKKGKRKVGNSSNMNLISTAVEQIICRN